MDVPATEVKEGSQSIYCGICDTKKSGSTVPILRGGILGQEDRYDLTQAKISWNHTDYVFSGEEILAEPVVSVGKKILEKDKDYRLTYKNNVNAGDEAVGKVIGKGYYQSIYVCYCITLGVVTHWYRHTVVVKSDCNLCIYGIRDSVFTA